MRTLRGEIDNFEINVRKGYTYFPFRSHGVSTPQILFSIAGNAMDLDLVRAEAIITDTTPYRFIVLHLHHHSSLGINDVALPPHIISV